MPKDYNDKTKLNATTNHHSIGLHYPGLVICVDIQCPEEDGAIVTQIVKYIKTLVSRQDRKSFSK